MINNRKLIVTVGIALLSFIIVGAFWEAEYNPFKPPARPTAASTFPVEQAARLRAVIETALARPGVLTTTPAEKTIQQDTLQWTVPEYVVQLENPTLSSEIAKALTEAVYANGGRIFQTYLPAGEQKAIIVVGVEAFITHTITLTWNVAPPAEMTPLPTPANAAGSFRAAIVIDDLGASAIAVQRLLEMPADFTFSILPQLEKSTEIATFLHEQQKETWLHLPMEPQGTEYPGQGAILANMPPEAIQQTITQDLESVPYVVGVSNHMGSRLTADVQTMQTVLETLRARQLFFLDSRTTPRTIAYKTAQQFGVKAAERKIFLDDIPQVEAVQKQLRDFIAIVEQGKPAIAVGHPKEATFQALKMMLPEFERRNIRIVRASQFVR